jgi:TolB-like protein/DNA-binding SARP family transcriptional activator
VIRFAKVCELMPPRQPSDFVLRFDSFELDPHAGELRRQGKKLRLQGQPFQTLAALMMRAGQLVTRAELRAEIWPADTFVDFDHSLHNAIARVRETLGDSPQTPRYIETLPRRGYRFIAPVETIRKAGPATATGEVHYAGAIQSLVVLPFDDHCGDAGHEYFADGMTEALITNLAKIKALRVISRTTAMQYRGARKSLPQIARELNVVAVIEGSVLRVGNRVRIAVQLINALTDQHLWAESYERDFRDILTLQADIARQVAEAIWIFLTPEERALLGTARRVNPEAHELYLKARYFWNKRTEEGVRKALVHFRRAIDIDPLYARGYAGLADCYNILGYYCELSPGDAYPKARAAATKSLELDEHLAEAHAALGVVKRDYEWDWEGAETDFQRAMELNPGYVEAYHWHSTLLCIRGKPAESIQEKEKALTMDPLSVVILTDIARMFYFSRVYDQAVVRYRAALDLDPSFVVAHIGLARVYEQQGRFDLAIPVLKTSVRLAPDSALAFASLGQGFAVAGNIDGARKTIEQLKALSAQRYVSPYDIASIHTGMRSWDEAFEWFEQAYQERSISLGYLNIEPQLDELHSDPRFQALVRKVGC